MTDWISPGMYFNIHYFQPKMLVSRYRFIIPSLSYMFFQDKIYDTADNTLRQTGDLKQSPQSLSNEKTCMESNRDYIEGEYLEEDVVRFKHVPFDSSP